MKASVPKSLFDILLLEKSQIREEIIEAILKKFKKKNHRFKSSKAKIIFDGLKSEIRITKKTEKKYTFTKIDRENAELLLELIQKNNADVKQPNLDNWAQDFRDIRVIDKKPDEQTKYLIKWTQKHDFWMSNILSPSKLRKQWDTLVIQVKAERKPQTKEKPVAAKIEEHPDLKN